MPRRARRRASLPTLNCGFFFLAMVRSECPKKRVASSDQLRFGTRLYTNAPCPRQFLRLRLQESPSRRPGFFTDAKPTLISIAALAGIFGDVLHEALGHGVTAYLSGAQGLTLSTLALQSDKDTRLIAAIGTLVKLIAGAMEAARRRTSRPHKPQRRMDQLWCNRVRLLYSCAGARHYIGRVDCRNPRQ